MSAADEAGGDRLPCAQRNAQGFSLSVAARARTVATVVLGLGLLACLAVLAHGLYMSSDRSTAMWRHVIPMVGVLVFVLALRAAPALRVNIAVLVIALGIALLALEAVLSVVQRDLYTFRNALSMHFASARDVNTLDGRAQVAAANGVKFDTRSRLQVVRDLERRGVRSYPSIFPTILMTGDGAGPFLTPRLIIDGIPTLPFGGISNVTTILCNESGEYTIYEADEHGFNNPRGIWGREGVQVAAVGDSFTIGACVPARKGFVDLIRDAYPATLNLGMDNNGPLTEFAGVREYLSRVRPRVVLWFYYEGNDLEDLWYEKSAPLLMRYLGDAFSQQLTSRQPAIDAALAAYIERSKAGARAPRWKQIVTLFHVREAITRMVRRPDASPPVSRHSVVERDLLRQILTEARRHISTWGGRLYFVYLPSWDRYAERPAADRQDVRALVRELGIPLIDIDAAFLRAGDPLALFPFRQDGHYNEKGHRLVADAVLRELPAGL